MKVTAFSKPVNSVTLGILSTGYVSTSSNSYASAVASNSYAINGVTVTGAAASNYHILASSPTAAAWVPDSGANSAIGSVTVSGAAASNYHIVATSSTAASWQLDTPSAVVAIAFVIDGGGSAIATGVKGDLLIPFGCIINEATTLADQSGSIVIDVWKDTYANFPPTVADTITASAKPTISSATKAQDSTLTGWSKVITAGDTLRFNVDSCTTITRATLTLKATRT